MASRRNLSLAGALVALVALVAIASRAHSPAGNGGSTRDLSSQLIWEYLLIGTLGAVIICLPFVAWALWMSRGSRPRTRKPRSPWRGLFTLGVLAVMATLLSTRPWHGRLQAQRPPEQPTGGIPGQLPTPHSKPATSAPFDWLPAIVVLVVATGGALVVARILFRPRKQRPPTRAELAAQLSSVLDDSLADLLAERDPRRAVIATYARMERTLAGAGLPRTAAEAPLEYLGRVLRDLLHASAGAVSKLTMLFERAKFSQHEIDTGMKDEAIAALVSVRDELRAATP